ncbi:bifunctional (p)ppGpp synthetase/guanosine-3',5'-bis(diphosphate) 3'-pyrophosphohydrolase [filamentous cyanobacterium LEGE 11480]|uniref:Bifunctional (P)ppGpp synthetase/guanosine-3',5'-bis(Diphosphate) 3'-pyrophosphohydrolase n=1 Tax=Romeriopsis navalis LEGE 11480 TaxID=2777977 RepID=A0A928VU24_9CYAN|nr:HD domain-containing protein [Romeriopsis navalis]MBE9033071.1 bifunctional (p)ppGpp synthetase/guanosine-3',5'-bis(diphosphate) 3'-pyrophosphohydrolase [Romeriopsis navalis LEGE 11480]
MWTQADYIKAYRFAAERHNGQKYPGTDLPYITHLSFVCMEVIAALRVSQVESETVAIQCALLHDVIEDTATTYAEVKQEFGAEVANGVMALTKSAALDKPLQMPDSLRRLKQQPAAVQMVKLADRISNLQAPPAHWTTAKMTAYREEAIVIHAALKGANRYLADRLQQKITDYQQWLA